MTFKMIQIHTVRLLLQYPKNYAIFYVSKRAENTKIRISQKVHKTIFLTIPTVKISILIKRMGFKLQIAIVSPLKISFTF